MKTHLIISFVSVLACVLLACEPQVTSTCEGCEFFEFEYSETLSIISGFDTTRVLVEQPYPDWELVDTAGSPEIVYSNIQASDSTIVMRITVEAGAGSEDARGHHEIGYDGEKFRVWYGSASRQFFKGKSQTIPRPPYFRIRKIEVLTPYQKEAEIDFKIRFGRQ